MFSRRLDESFGMPYHVTTVSGIPLGPDQNENSLLAEEGESPTTSASGSSFIRIGPADEEEAAEYEIFFFPPSGLEDDQAAVTTLTVELVVQLTSGTGAKWMVDIWNHKSDFDDWEQIGSLASAGTDSWSQVTITLATADGKIMADYPSSTGDLVLRIHADAASGAELAYIDFAQVTSSTEAQNPSPTSTDVPTTPTPVEVALTGSPSTAAPATTAPTFSPQLPVTPTPISPPGTTQRWEAFAQFVPDWEVWKNTLQDGQCDRWEECRTESACCDSPNLSVCGNGLCEEDETQEACPQDCTHALSICGDLICENGGGYHTNKYEDEYSCPVDCKDSPNLDTSSSSKTGSCFMEGSTCTPECGDGVCDPSDSCETCPRDCGECPPVAGDGLCAFPFEPAGAGDCTGTLVTNFITYNGEDYASIDDQPVLAPTYDDDSCTSAALKIPAGWRLADWDPMISKDLVTVLGATFSTGCLVFTEGNSVSSYDGQQGDNETGCGIIPILKHNGNQFSLAAENCPARIVVQRIKADGSKSCPDCLNGGRCNPLTGTCSCAGMWTGPQCERAIGDFSVSASTSSWYQPGVGTTWEWQIDGQPIPGANGAGELYDVELYDIDISYPSTVVDALQAKGKKVMCYVSAGTYEEFRDDRFLFSETAMGGEVSFGEGDTFEDEKWLDLRRLDLIAPIMLERLDILKAKGCDAVEWDNADLPVHETKLKEGGRISLDVQIAYNAWIAAQTHQRGMGVAMKNNNEAAAFHVEDYDMVVNEECWINGNCRNYWPWIKAGKPILNTEYFTTRCMYCDRANAMGLSTIKKVPDLTACRADCTIGADISTVPCDSVALSGSVSFPIDWTTMNSDWCPMSANNDISECPAPRFRDCEPSVGY